MRKHIKKSKPVTRASLYWISTEEVYAVFAMIGGIVLLLLLLLSCVRILQGKMSASGLSGVALAGFAIISMLLLIGFIITQTRTIPPYHYYRGHDIHFPACLKGKSLTCTDQVHYLYVDDTWFVAALTMGASALCADVIDFSVPIVEKTLSGKGNVAFIYQFQTKDGAVIVLRLGRRVKSFNKWVRAHGGSFA